MDRTLNRGVRSDGKLRTQFGRDANWTPGLRIDGTPERARLRQELAITFAPDFGEPFERESSGFADPCAKRDFVAERGGRFVIDLMAQHDPADRFLSVRTGDCSSARLQYTLSSSGARWRLFRLATQAPGQVAGHHVSDHGKQHKEYGDPKNPTVVHSLPARAMGMIAMVLMIVFCLMHKFLAFNHLPRRGVSLPSYR